MAMLGKGILSRPIGTQNRSCSGYEINSGSRPSLRRMGQREGQQHQRQWRHLQPWSESTPVVEYKSSKFLCPQHVGRGTGLWSQVDVSGTFCPSGAGSVLTAVVEQFNIVVYVPSVLELTDITVMLDTRLCKTVVAEIWTSSAQSAYSCTFCSRSSSSLDCISPCLRCAVRGRH